MTFVKCIFSGLQLLQQQWQTMNGHKMYTTGIVFAIRL